MLPDDKIAQLKQYLSEKKSYSVCAELLGCTRGVIAGTVSRYINNKPKRADIVLTNSRWTEENLTESWIDYTARKKAERLQQKAQYNEMDSLAESH